MVKVRIDADQFTIPGYFRDSIHRFFGEAGDVWFSELGERLQACVGKWHLVNCMVADNLSVNLICYADSPEYGPVVLKIGFPHPEFYSELAALALYNGGKVCALYDADLDLGAMLLERVLPGYNLKTEQDVEERLRTALRVIPNLPMPVDIHPSIPAFADWIDRAFARARREQKVCPMLLTYLDETEALFYEVTAQEPANYLLHGDLHHENMLYRANGDWVVIDPKGVTGIPSLEAGRYILNAISFTAEGQRRQALEHMVSAFAEAFKRPRRILAICALVDCILSRTWTFEEHLTPEAFAREEAESLRLFPLYMDCVKKG
jgi:streptomycin 6-kinase